MGVEDDAKERAAAREGAAVGELGVVGEDGADAGEDGVGGVAEELHFVARGGAGEPEGLVGIAGGRRRSEFSVDRKRGLEGDEGGSMLYVVGEGVVQVAGWLFEDAKGDCDVGGAKFLNALAADQGVGVLRCDDAAGDTGGDESVGTGRGAAVVAAGLERDVGGGSFGGEAAGGGLFEGDYFGVVAVVVEVCAFADDLRHTTVGRVLCQNAAYLRVRGGEANGFGGELEGSLHEDFVRCGRGVSLHDFEDIEFSVFDAREGTPSPRGDFGHKILLFNSLQRVGVCKIFIIRELQLKYFLSMS